MTGCDEIRVHLEAFAVGELDGMQMAGVREHLRACAGCRELLALEQLLVRTAHLTPPEPVPSGFAERVIERWKLEAPPVLGAMVAVPTSLPELLATAAGMLVRNARFAGDQVCRALALVGEETLRRLAFGLRHARLALSQARASAVSALRLTYELNT